MPLLVVAVLSGMGHARTFFSRPTEMQHCLANSYIRKAIAQARDRHLEEWETLARLIEYGQLTEDEWDHARKVIQAIYSDRRVSPNTVANDYMTWCKKALGSQPADPVPMFPVWKYRE
jgi:hypothetical protein